MTVSRPLLTLAALTATFLPGCVQVDVVSCTSSEQCQPAYGLLAQCDAQGFCGAGEVLPRCADTEPEGLLTDPAYADYVILAHLYDRPKRESLEKNAVSLAVQEVNRKDGFSGTPFGVVHCDNSVEDGSEVSSEEVSVDIMEWLSQTLGEVPVVGPYDSSTSLATFQALESQGGAFFISPAATSPALTTVDGVEKSDEKPGTFWRTPPPDSLQGSAAAEDMRSRDVSVVALIYAEGPYGEGLSGEFERAFEAGGGDVAKYGFRDRSSLSEAFVEALDNPEVEEVFFVASAVEDIRAFFDAAKIQGFGPTDGPGGTQRNIFLSDGAASSRVVEAITGASELFPIVRGTRPWLNTSTDNYKVFELIYNDEFQADASDAVFISYAFDATWLAMYASIWSIVHEGEITYFGLGSGMRRMSEPDGPVVNLRPSEWKAGVEYFEQGQAINVRGVTGELDFDPVTEETTTPIQIWGLASTDDGFDFVVLETIDL